MVWSKLVTYLPKTHFLSWPYWVVRNISKHWQLSFHSRSDVLKRNHVFEVQSFQINYLGCVFKRNDPADKWEGNGLMVKMHRRERERGCISKRQRRVHQSLDDHLFVLFSNLKEWFCRTRLGNLGSKCLTLISIAIPFIGRAGIDTKLLQTEGIVSNKCSMPCPVLNHRDHDSCVIDNRVRNKLPGLALKKKWNWSDLPTFM